MAGKKRDDIPDAGATMQIDAIDDLEDLGPPGGYLPDPGPSLPPPLPPKKASKAMWAVGALVVVLMIALGVGAGFVLFAGEPAPVASPVPAAPVTAAPAPATAPAEPAVADEPAEQAAEPGVMQLDEVVFPAEP